MDSVTLTEMLDARERRVYLQQNMIQACQCPLICLTLNIPGPIKIFDGVEQAFEEGCHRVETILSLHGFLIKQTYYIKEKTGCEAYYSINADPVWMKQLMADLESSDTLGRLFDIDVIKADGCKISREELGLAPRTCYLCGEPAHACSRSRKHSIAELTSRISEIIKEGL